LLAVLDDEELTATLESLGLGRDNHRAVVLLPLIEVAWADGRVQTAERLRIVQIARQYGFDGKSAWLTRWLRRRPSHKTFLAARTALLDLMARSGHGEEPIASLDDLINLCVWIAEAAGGLFGLAFTVERSERECIEQIAASLALGPALPDGLVEQWEQSRRRHFLAEAPTNMRRRPRYGILDETTAHLNFGVLTTAALETDKLETDQIRTGQLNAGRRRSSTTPTLDPPAPSRPTLDPPEPPPPPPPFPFPARRVLPSLPPPKPEHTTERPPPVPAHLAAASRASVPAPLEERRPRSTVPRSAVPRSTGPRSAGTRASEEDPTLPFFDDVNVGTYVEPSD
jgi:tellurite resistance protein